MEKLIVSNDTFFEEVIALLREGKKVTVPAKGESMLPFIVGGVDPVVLEGVDGGSPAGTVLRTANVGDVVLFRADGRFILHRIIYKDNDKALCEIQGDGILRAKDLCDCDQIYGRVTTVLKGGVTPVDVDSPSYRRKVWLWMNTVLVRRILLWVWKRFFMKRELPELEYRRANLRYLLPVGDDDECLALRLGFQPVDQHLLRLDVQ